MANESGDILYICEIFPCLSLEDYMKCLFSIKYCQATLFKQNFLS